MRPPECRQKVSKEMKVMSEVALTIDELEVISAWSAYALTRSSDTQTVLGTGDHRAESNREIFLPQHIDTGRKIPSYLFNTQP